MCAAGSPAGHIDVTNLALRRHGISEASYLAAEICSVSRAVCETKTSDELLVSFLQGFDDGFEPDVMN